MASYKGMEQALVDRVAGYRDLLTRRPTNARVRAIVRSLLESELAKLAQLLNVIDIPGP